MQTGVESHLRESERFFYRMSTHCDNVMTGAVFLDWECRMYVRDRGPCWMGYLLA